MALCLISHSDAFPAPRMPISELGFSFLRSSVISVTSSARPLLSLGCGISMSAM